MPTAAERVVAVVRGWENQAQGNVPPPAEISREQPLRWLVLTAALPAAGLTTIGGVTCTVPAVQSANPALWQGSANGGAGGYMVDTTTTYQVVESTALRSYSAGAWLLCRPVFTATGAVWEPVAIGPPRQWCVAQSDWDLNAGSPKVSVKTCTDYLGGTAVGAAFDVYFVPRAGNYCPAVFAGDVLAVTWDAGQGRFVCDGPDGFDDALGTVKYFWPSGEHCTLGAGWHACDGSTPDGSKIGALPDTRGLFTRAKEDADTLWTGGATIGAADNSAGGGHPHVGVSSSRAADGAPESADNVVTQLEDVESWKGAAHDGSTVNDAVVCPPCFVLQQIVRYK